MSCLRPVCYSRILIGNMRSLEPEDIQLVLQSFDSRTASRGNSYFHTGRVASCERLDGESYRFLVQGSQRRSYNVNVTFCGHRLVSSCSCPMMDYCKHVYACLLFLKKNGDLQLAGQTPKEQERSRTGFFALVPDGRALSNKEVDSINK